MFFYVMRCTRDGSTILIVGEELVCDSEPSNDRDSYIYSCSSDNEPPTSYMVLTS